LELADKLRPGDLMIFNNTKVIPARLEGHRYRDQSNRRDVPGPGPRIEVTLHKRDESNIWRAFAKPGKKLAVDDIINFADDFSAEVTNKGDGGEITLRFNKVGKSLTDALHQYGAMPLPPYIHRDNLQEPKDPSDYQTMFAAHEGAVAAPTAGLHFTPAMFSAINARGIKHAFVTLHVGAGTFLPVKVDDTTDHVMHSEWGEIDADTIHAIEQTRAGGSRIVAVGTTALRVLESAATSEGIIEPFSGNTDIFITPGYQFQAVDILMTNFHLPRSTLFMLICAFAGLDHMQSAYKHAKAGNYRFYSYGDACLLERA
ncbi:MAG: tRNA preQ1(34) S-adenosylmethionine ribosyltransferase-isomerase QueA, partial [Rhodospirillales bacterium]|nr:tRNA preQ1(34) S-adenosylmethionine ribosyltransferase-isomerase QueA [Rhodospirillales bacterium]